MQTKLTLTIDKNVIEEAKDYAQKSNRSVSKIVEEYLKIIVKNKDSFPSLTSLRSPITNKISGMFKDNGKPYKDMVAEALEDKYL
jgi:hypothetical protein